ncbi:MAG: hypothetical protein JWP89_3996 [Schlesneria sp.]|nr:hypothetical protein [Schlesneria sp.]
MLDRLDQIPWHSLHHAYGTAEDVPGLIRALAGSGDEQDQALGDLFSNIWHQGTVYEASSYAVPFLVELAVEPTITHREVILSLIASLAEGNSYLQVHAQPGHKISDYFRQQPDFEAKLAAELEHVRRAHQAVLEHCDLICTLFQDNMPLVRVGAGYIMSRFPEQLARFGPVIRQAIQTEQRSLVQSALILCLGALRDSSPETIALMDRAVHYTTNPRQAFAAALALYRIQGEYYPAAVPLYRQLAAAKWAAESFLGEIPWDIESGVQIQTIATELEPDPVGATQTLLTLLKQSEADNDPCTAIVHDLLELNFPEGKWRKYKRLTATQTEILRRLVESHQAWQNPKRLWFLVPNGAKKLSDITADDLQAVRNEMRAVILASSRE